MDKEQASALLNLAKKLKKETTSKEAAIKSLSSAGILTKDGKLTKPYSKLNRLISAK